MTDELLQELLKRISELEKCVREETNRNGYTEALRDMEIGEKRYFINQHNAQIRLIQYAKRMGLYVKTRTMQRDGVTQIMVERVEYKEHKTYRPARRGRPPRYALEKK